MDEGAYDGGRRRTALAARVMQTLEMPRIWRFSDGPSKVGNYEYRFLTTPRGGSQVAQVGSIGSAHPGRRRGAAMQLSLRIPDRPCEESRPVDNCKGHGGRDSPDKKNFTEGGRPRAEAHGLNAIVHAAVGP